MDTKFLQEDKFVKCDGRAETVKKWFGIEDTPQRLALTDIPVGYNLRGKIIVFTRTEVTKWYNRGYEAPIGMLMATGLGYDPEYDPPRLAIHADSAAITAWDFQVRVLENEHSGEGDDLDWARTVFHFPPDRDIIVTENTLFPHSGDIWGFDFAFVE